MMPVKGAWAMSAMNDKARKITRKRQHEADLAVTAKADKKTRLCCNDDGRPVCPPSVVLCRECLTELDQKMHRILGALGDGEVKT